MRRERFEALAGAFGGDIRRWPAAEQDAARALAATDAAAAGLLALEARLDSVLDAAPVLGPGAALVGRVLSAAGEATAASRRVWRWLGGAGIGATLAAACAAGVLVGAYAIPADWAHAVLAAPADPAEEASALFGDGPEPAAFALAADAR